MQLKPDPLDGQSVADYELRQATADDLEFIRAVKFSGLRPYVEELWGWDDGDQEQRFLAGFVPEQQQVIRYRDEDIGVLHVEDREGSLSLVGIYINSNNRSKGIGAAVIRDVLARAGRIGKPVTLQVLRPNPARRLYERLGFVVTDETETHFTMEASSPAT